MKTIESDYDMAVELVLRKFLTCDLSILNLKTEDCTFKLGNTNSKYFDSSCEMGLYTRETIVLDVLHNSERFSIQHIAIGIGFPDEGYPIFDSRKETKT
jgi:hypothetical protein